MKKISVLLLLISFLLFTETFAEPNLESFGQKIKRGAERSKEFALSKDTGNFLIFALSAGFLAYLPRHLSDPCLGPIDKTINYFPREFLRKRWTKHLYYEFLTLLAGYICLKTGKPILEKIKSN